MENVIDTLIVDNISTISNKFVKKPPKFGDHIRVSRYLGLYAHHGIYVSDNEVYHFSDKDKNMKNAKIVCTSLKEFLDGGVLKVREYNEEQLKKKNSPQQTVENARKHLGCKKGEYSFIMDNCEDFANFCVFNEKGSKQVKLYSRGIIGVLGSVSLAGLSSLLKGKTKA